MVSSRPTTEELKRKADEAYELGRFVEASHLYEQLIDRQPKSPEYQHKLGRAYAQRGRQVSELGATRISWRSHLRNRWDTLRLQTRQEEEFVRYHRDRSDLSHLHGHVAVQCGNGDRRKRD